MQNMLICCKTGNDCISMSCQGYYTSKTVDELPNQPYTFIYRKHSINKTSISTTSIITVKLFVTMAGLAQGQTSVITVKIGAHMVKIGLLVTSHSKNLILQFNSMFKKN